MIAPADKIVVCFAHVAYRLQERFAAFTTEINSFAVRDADTLMRRVGDADVLVISGLWQNHLLDHATSFVSSSRSVPAPTNSRAKSWQRVASGWPAPAVSMHARWPSMRWR
jgi:hypothetical protein